jgi:hypothetical protein
MPCARSESWFPAWHESASRRGGGPALSGEAEAVTMKQEDQQLRNESGMATPPSLRGLVEVALEIARRRRETLGRLRKALDAGNEREALKLARELCGLHEKSDRAHQSVN